MRVPVSATDNRCHLRSATHGDLAVPRIRLARYGKRSFSVSGPLLWNSLPLTVRDVSLTLTQFFTRLKTCFPEPTGHHHSASVTVSAVKFVCANTNLLTYLLTYLLIYLLTRSPNQSTALRALTFNLLIQKVDRFMPLSSGPLLPICIEVGSFVYKILCSQVW